MDAADRSGPGRPDVDESGRSYAVLAFGPDAERVATTWRARLAALGRTVWSWSGERATDAALAALAEQTRVATVGWRLLLAGPEADVLRARAVAITGGAVDAELTVVVTDDRRRRVWCAHCGSTTEADVRAGDDLPCADCGRTLSVHAHVSRHRAAYLGAGE
ncbi:dimethylamine monooxygenase subunit DmmA family protein [Cryptosporangium minutisporangium]|uniref:Dimethylamine monooxygenase subunit DmmA family protein n=1 Tax=Cryptosporangium minutisporangium TaxID=113569 RepID=A0ABP6T3T5_9ACTN